MSKNREFIEKILNKYTEIKLLRIEKKKILDPRRQKIISENPLTSDQVALIDELYRSKYGKVIPKDWHRLYQSFSGIFQAEYFPELLFSSKLEPSFNPWSYRYVLDDKLLLSVFTTGINSVKLPELIGGFANGVFYDNERNVLTKDEFIRKLCEVDECIFKQTRDTDSGRGVQIAKFSEEKEVEKIIESYNKQSFVVQKIVKPHKTLSDIYPYSINTFRVVTYVWEGHIYHFPISLRLGRNGSRIDNAHAGGIFVGISDEGRFADAAFTEFKDKFYEHPDTGFVFKGASLPYTKELIDVATKLHVNALCLGIISWDLTVDESGMFVLVEANTNGQTVWFPQMATGKPAFGENTSAILQRLGKKK